LWKLLISHIIPVVAVTVLVVWMAIDRLAADYFSELVQRHHVAPVDAHRMFLAATHRYLIWGTLAALTLSLLLSYALITWVLRPLFQMTAITRQVADGNYSERVNVVSRYEVGQLANSFNLMAENLERIELLRKNMVADISHELRTPLSILRGEIEAIQDGVRQADPDSMRSLHAEVMRLSRLVDDLYQLSLSDIGALSYRKINLDLRALLADAVASFRPEFAHKGIVLTSELAAEGNCTIFADPGRLHQLFDNLMDNALKYTDSGGALVIRLACQGDHASVVLEDSGPGVAPQDLERIFDRLYRVESSRNRALGGAGLGLAICRNIVDAHEGKISALPSPLGGVQISIQLPVTGSTT
jgi:two-component system, OmpR family, sensor histidine kinase BaeS